MRLNLVIMTAVLLCAGAGWFPANAEQTAPDSSLAAMQADVAILPIVNYSEHGQAHDLLLPRLYEKLARAGVSYLDTEQLRPLLRTHRIRIRGWVGRNGAETIARETGAKYLLLGSWDVLRSESDPEIGLSLRVLELKNMRLIKSVSVGAAGSDFTGMLGLGRVANLGELADIVLESAVDALFPLSDGEVVAAADGGCNQIALIPLDNYSGTPNAGNIVTNIILSSLMSHGYSVVEPGFVRELGLSKGVISQGGVDRASALAIHETFDVCRVITGDVERFAMASGDPTRTVPSIAIGIRVMSPEDGNVYVVQELERDGDDGEWPFQRGRIHALVPLVNRALERFLKDKDNREDIIYGQRVR